MTGNTQKNNFDLRLIDIVGECLHALGDLENNCHGYFALAGLIRNCWKLIIVVGVTVVV